MKWSVNLVLVISWTSLWAQNVDQKPSLDYRIMIEQESTYDFDLGELQKSEWIIDTEATLKLNKKLKIFGQLRLYSELTDKLEPGRPDLSNFSNFSKPLSLGNRGQLELRELYADLTIGKSYWRFGKQQVVWGEMDGLKILDVLNPMSFREFILDDFDDSRIPLWAISGNIRWGKFNIQPYWSPDITSHQFPSAGGLYFPSAFMTDLAENADAEIVELGRPGKFFKDSDLGVQVSSMLSGWDVTLNYIYQYDKTAVYNRSFDYANEKLLIQPVLKRQHMIGGSFGKTQGLFGLRTEIAFFPKKHFMSGERNDNGLFTSGQILTGIALDYFGISEAILTFQWFGDIIKDVPIGSLVARGKMTNTTTLMVTKYMMNQQIEIEAFAGYRFDEKAAMLDIKTSYLIKDNLKIWIGGDLFSGDNHGFIGSYSERDRVSVGFEWGLQSNK